MSKNVYAKLRYAVYQEKLNWQQHEVEQQQLE